MKKNNKYRYPGVVGSSDQELKTRNVFQMMQALCCIALLTLTIFSSSCKKLVEVGPPITSTNGASVYNVDASAAAVLTGLYANISKGDFASGSSSISLLSGLSADEFTLYGGVPNTDFMYYYYTNALYTASGNIGNPGTEYWVSAYRYIYVCNSAIEGLTNSSKLSPAVKKQLLGEAKFVRAFLYFYLVNLYGPVPLATSSDYEVNSHFSRSSVNDVYKLITEDLLDAKKLLSDNYLGADAVTPTAQRIRPTKWAATALLARVYLYTGNFADAEEQATLVIDQSTLFQLLPLNNVFFADSKEAIWQLQPVNYGWNTEDANIFIIPSSGPNYGNPNLPVYLSSNLLNSFESGDKRKVDWIDSVNATDGHTYFYAYKYKSATYGDPVTEYLMMLRLGEQYLIRAEARAQQGKSNALADINSIRARAGLPAYAGATDKTSLLAIILHERQVELFTEWGQRWLDLKRTGEVNSIMSAACASKGGTWNSNQQLYPILLSDIKKNPALTQNSGY